MPSGEQWTVKVVELVLKATNWQVLDENGSS